MRSINDLEVLQEVNGRLSALTGQEQALWGKMTVSQMLVHCRKQLELGTGELPGKPMFPKPILWLAKQLFGFRIPWSKNLPTAPEMVARKEADFEVERKNLLNSIEIFRESDSFGVHPIFGEMDKSEWGKIAYKHLDHHLRQFGA